MFLYLRDPIAQVGRIAQLAEQLTLNQRVAGSSPAAPTKYLLYINSLELFLGVIFSRCPINLALAIT